MKQRAFAQILVILSFILLPQSWALDLVIPKSAQSSVTELPAPQFRHRRYLVEFKRTSMAKDQRVKFSSDFKLNADGQMVFQVKTHPSFTQNSIEAHALKEILVATIEKTDYPEQALERYMNLSDKEDALSQVDALEIILEHFQKLENNLAPFVKNQLLPQLSQLLREQKLIARTQNQKRLRLKTQRKNRLDRLDRDQHRQLKNLVAQNRRPQVAELLRQYLPWEDMALIEKKYWLTTLEAIARPVPLEQRVVLLRGLDQQNNTLHFGEVGRVQRPFMFSVIIDKNQGSYNRRLRSLETMYTKYITATQSKPRLNHRFSRSQRLSNMAKNHSEDPKGSPLLSFSTDLRVVKEFSQKGLFAIAVDPRLLLPGSLSPFNENEWLTPLLSFPDETLVYLEQTQHLTEAQLWEEIESSLLGLYTSSRVRTLINSWKKNQIPVFLSQYQFQTFTRPFFFELSRGANTTPRPVTEYKKILYNLR